MTPEAFEQAVRRLFTDIPAMTLAVCVKNVPWAADVYFAQAGDGFGLVFFSSPRSRHCRTLAENPACAATIHAAAASFKEIRGLQMEGTARPLEGAAAKAGALAAYVRKFPFVKELMANPVLTAQKLGGAAPHLFSPSRIRLVDNAQGFGTRYAVRITDGRIDGPPVLERNGEDAAPVP